MEIKRNIFDSSAKMPPRYEPVGPPLDQDDVRGQPIVGLQRNDRNIAHAPCPRIGEAR